MSVAVLMNFGLSLRSPVWCDTRNMLFNSVTFVLFFASVFLLYWFVFNRNLRLQNLLLLAASYFFYASWDWRFLFLLMFSTGLDFFTGLRISQSTTIVARRFWLWLSISINLGFLAVFKYYDFFITSFIELLGQLGFHMSPWTLGLILPVGISFYTFHGLSYIIDIYNRRIEAETNVVDYSVFVSFFPLLVAGPIERATHLLPQIKRPRVFDNNNATDGMRQFLWGLVKKVLIADQCALYVDDIFTNHASYGGSTLLLGAMLFAVQIYGDFSGYSDMALGVARILGIELLKNFSYPYFSRDIAEFWRRWHISLTTWFRDYIYIPLGGSKGGKLQSVRNTFVIFILSGLWHGANWTFIVWGILNALYFLPLLLTGNNRKNIGVVAEGKLIPSLRDVVAIGLTFLMTTFAWIFFRSPSIGFSFDYISGIFNSTLISVPHFALLGKLFLFTMFLIGVFFVVEWIGRDQDYAIRNIGKWKWPLRWSFYYGTAIMIILLAVKGKS